MTKKHFIALADEFRRTKPMKHGGNIDYCRGLEDGKGHQWEMMLNHFAEWLEYTYPAFNRQRWLDYIAGKCGPGGGEIKPVKASREQCPCDDCVELRKHHA